MKTKKRKDTLKTFTVIGICTGQRHAEPVKAASADDAENQTVEKHKNMDGCDGYVVAGVIAGNCKCLDTKEAGYENA